MVCLARPRRPRDRTQDMTDASRFAGGRNIAMKVPPHLWDATVRFYRDVAGLPVIEHEPTQPPSVGFRFGANNLWVDRVDHVSHAEVWLELSVDDVEAAAGELRDAGVVRRDEIEPLGESFRGFWIANPAGIIHMVSEPDQDGY
jgi:catechol 2,3-dioxygenase-like lactoylglutathione lyase family enzyme